MTSRPATAATSSSRRSTTARAPKDSKPPLTIIGACEGLFADWFKGATFTAWFAFLKSLFAISLNEAELAIFRECTGRNMPAPGGYLEATLICGRRGGKSLAMALIAVFLACFHDWRPFLTGGERGVIMIIAADRKQAAVLLRYIRGMLDIPLLQSLIQRETADTLELRNSITIEIQTASYRSIRGRTVVACLADELAFWVTESDGVSPDSEIMNAIKPAMATIPRAMLIKASSPYARRGVLWLDHQKHFGKDGSQVLVWQAPTRVMNPSVPESFIAAAIEDDAAAAGAEYLAQFRNDLEAFISREIVESAVDRGVLVRPPRSDITNYVSGIDPSGGQKDSFCAAVSHNENGSVVLDCLLEIKAPFNSVSATERVSELLKSYGLTSTTSDRYAAGWVVDAFAKCGITIRHSERNRSEIFLDVLPLFTSGRARILDIPRLVNQCAALERKTSALGRDQVTHPPGGSDDSINAAALSMVLAAAERPPMKFAAPIIITRPRDFPLSLCS